MYYERITTLHGGHSPGNIFEFREKSGENNFDEKVREKYGKFIKGMSSQKMLTSHIYFHIFISNVTFCYTFDKLDQGKTLNVREKSGKMKS